MHYEKPAKFTKNNKRNHCQVVVHGALRIFFMYRVEICLGAV